MPPRAAKTCSPGTVKKRGDYQSHQGFYQETDVPRLRRRRFGLCTLEDRYLTPSFLTVPNDNATSKRKRYGDYPTNLKPGTADHDNATYVTFALAVAGFYTNLAGGPRRTGAQVQLVRSRPHPRTASDCELAFRSA
jgi:hypothetical protein